MRTVSLLLIVLLAFQCMPHSVRVKAVSVCMQKGDVNPDDVAPVNPGTLLEDEIPHFILTLHKPEPARGSHPFYGYENSHWPDEGCRIPGNVAHDIETPPPNAWA